MLESMVEWMSFPMYYAFEGAPPPVRAGAAHASIYPYGPFPVGDGSTIMLGLQNEREWLVFCEKVLLDGALAADERFSSNSRRTANRDALRDLIVAAFSGLTGDEVAERLEVAGIANAHVNDMAGVWNHAQLKARNRWRNVDSSAGTLPALLPPASSNAFEPRMDGIPAVGQHTDSVLASLGFDEAAIKALHASRAV